MDCGIGRPARSVGLAFAILCSVYGMAKADNQADKTSPFQTVFSVTRPLVVSGGWLREGSRVSRTTAKVSFRLPANASRLGRTGGYIVDVHLRVHVAQEIRSKAVGEVSIGTNGYDAGTVSWQRIAMLGNAATAWSTYDLFNGMSDGVVFGQSMDLRFRNYIQYRGARPGLNTLEVSIWNYAGTVVQSAEIAPGSRVVYSNIPPPNLSLNASLSSSDVLVGRELTLKYVIRNAGLPARNVGVIAFTSGIGLSPIAPPSHFWEWVASARGTMRFQALVPGTYEVVLGCAGASGTGGIGRALQRFTVRVLRPRATENMNGIDAGKIKRRVVSQ